MTHDPDFAPDPISDDSSPSSSQRDGVSAVVTSTTSTSTSAPSTTPSPSTSTSTSTAPSAQNPADVNHPSRTDPHEDHPQLPNPENLADVSRIPDMTIYYMQVFPDTPVIILGSPVAVVSSPTDDSVQVLYVNGPYAYKVMSARFGATVPGYAVHIGGRMVGVTPMPISFWAVRQPDPSQGKQ